MSDVVLGSKCIFESVGGIECLIVDVCVGM